MTIHPLPPIMVAPNGARKTKQDHPALPLTLAETVATAKACYQAGATGLHAHVRDEQGKHILDAERYQALIAEMALSVPNMQVQITTEAVGIYTPEQQRALVKAVKPKAVSVSLREMLSAGLNQEVIDFYQDANDDDIALQHILYSVDDVRELRALCEAEKIPNSALKVLLVLGRYSANLESQPSDLDPLLIELKQFNSMPDWAVCAFGKAETDCLHYAWQQGGKIRIGFENSLWRSDGTQAQDNADRVAEIVAKVSK